MIERMNLVYQEGGVIVLVLAGLSILSFAILLEKFFLIFLDFIKNLKKENLESSLKEYIVIEANNSLIKVINLAMKEKSFSPSRCFLKLSLEKVNGLKSSLWFISFSIQIAPILGVLGTIIGISQSMKGIDLSNQESILFISKGFSKALVTSIFGLSLGSGLLFFNSLINAYIEKLQKNFSLVYQSFLEWESNEC